MPRISHGMRVSAAAVTLGFLVAGPHAEGVAMADSTGADGSAVSAGPRASAQKPKPKPAVRRAAKAPTAARSAGAARSSARDRQAQPPRRDGIRRAAAAVTVPEKPGPTPGREPAPAAMPPSAPSVSAVVALPRPAAASDSAPEAAKVAAHSVGALRTALLTVVNSGLNRLNGLPGGPLTDFVSGALLMVRRSLEQAVGAAATGPVASAVSNGQTFVVSTLADSGAGSLRQAILDANATAGVNEISFTVAGTIRVGPTALPAVTDGAVIDGTTAPGFTGAPVVRVDFQNTDGLKLVAGASDSQILSLSLVDAAGAGVTIDTSDTVLSGNYIGIWGDGRRVEANRGDGVLVTSNAANNLIGVGADYVFALSNVISGNRGNGITISGGSGNIVEANYIGTDATGTKCKPNRGVGIQLTAGAADNLIGGERTGGNDPTDENFAVPPQGNLISANRSDGILIDDGATGNQLSGNFIGTNASGSAALGNGANGVAIVNADYNSLVGTTSLQNPFVFYNVISGNRGNGLVVHNADHTVVHANFFGMGADNNTVVANRGDGMLVMGDSTYVDSGGEIPLGNVMSGNRGYGIEIVDTAGGVVSFNNFVGQAAFGTTAKPNRAGGILVTSSNPGFDIGNEYTWNKIRTSLIGGNWGNGIAFLGDAHGAEVTDTSVGTDNTIKQPLPNLGNGILIGGNANQIAIGGFQPSVEEVDGGFSVYSGANRGYGIVIRGRANNNTVFNTRVGLGTGVTIDTAAKIPNRGGGIMVGSGTSQITIGGPRDAIIPGFRYMNEVVGNRGNGVMLLGAEGLGLLGSTISGNNASGVVLAGGRGITVGFPLNENVIADNGLFGVYATGRLEAAVESSTISDNGATGVRLAGARGISVGGGALSPTRKNIISGNRGWGILASGLSFGSALGRNDVANNASGEVNTTFALGLTTN